MAKHSVEVVMKARDEAQRRFSCPGHAGRVTKSLSVVLAARDEARRKFGCKKDVN